MSNQATYKVISMTVSDFTYNDYKNIFKYYPTQQYLLELLGFKSRLPIGIYEKVPSKIDNIADNIADSVAESVDTIALTTCKNREEYNEKTKDYKLVHKINNWTMLPGINEKNFTQKMDELFNHYLKIEYEIKKTEKNTVKEADSETDKETVIIIRRYYTMIERLETVQCIDFVNNESHFIDITNIKPNQLEYKPYLLEVYNFMAEHFEEISDNDIWEHELFSKGKHIFA